MEQEIEAKILGQCAEMIVKQSKEMTKALSVIFSKFEIRIKIKILFKPINRKLSK